MYDDGIVMIESAAILRFLSQKYPSLNKYYEGDIIYKQKIDAMLDFNGAEFRPAFAQGYIPKLVKMIKKNDEISEKE